MRFYCTSTGPIGGLNCEVLLYSTGLIGGLNCEVHITNTHIIIIIYIYTYVHTWWLCCSVLLGHTLPAYLGAVLSAP